MTLINGLVSNRYSEIWYGILTVITKISLVNATSFLFQYLVYLLDEGTIVKTEKILNYPKDWPSKPLLVFAKVQGLVRDNLELKNAAAKVIFLRDRLTSDVYLVFLIKLRI